MDEKKGRGFRLPGLRRRLRARSDNKCVVLESRTYGWNPNEKRGIVVISGMEVVTVSCSEKRHVNRYGVYKVTQEMATRQKYRG